MVVLATFTIIVVAISQTEDLIFRSTICLSGLSVGCEINRVFLKYRKRADIAKELSKITFIKYCRPAQHGRFKSEKSQSSDRWNLLYK